MDTIEQRLEAEANVGKNIIGPYGFTSGPYVVSESLDDDGNVQGLLIKPVGGQVVAEVDPLDNADANAQLLAAAPEMFDALLSAMPFIAAHANKTGDEGPIISLLQTIRTIIFNVTGEQS